jgi:hypothetical protein
MDLWYKKSSNTTFSFRTADAPCQLFHQHRTMIYRQGPVRHITVLLNLHPLGIVRPIYRTGTPLPSKHPILCIFSTNIHTEFFKNAALSPFFPLQNSDYFITLLCLVRVLFAFYIQGVLKFKCQIPVPKGYNTQEQTCWQLL